MDREKSLQNVNQEIKEQGSLHNLNDCFVNFHKQLEMKDDPITYIGIK